MVGYHEEGHDTRRKDAATSHLGRRQQPDHPRRAGRPAPQANRRVHGTVHPDRAVRPSTTTPLSAWSTAPSTSSRKGTGGGSTLRPPTSGPGAPPHPHRTQGMGESTETPVRGAPDAPTCVSKLPCSCESDLTRCATSDSHPTGRPISSGGLRLSRRRQGSPAHAVRAVRECVESGGPRRHFEGRLVAVDDDCAVDDRSPPGP